MAALPRRQEAGTDGDEVDLAPAEILLDDSLIPAAIEFAVDFKQRRSDVDVVQVVRRQAPPGPGQGLAQVVARIQ